MGKIRDFRYGERQERAKQLIDKVLSNNIKDKLKERNPELHIRTLTLQWVDQLYEERGIEYQLRANFRSFHLNVIGYQFIDSYIIKFDKLKSANINELTKELIRMIDNSINWQYNKFMDMSPEELEKAYEEIKEIDRLEGRF